MMIQVIILYEQVGTKNRTLQQHQQTATWNSRAKNMNPFCVVFERSEFMTEALKGLQGSSIFKHFQILLFQQQETHFLLIEEIFF